jgi:DNA repair exonuclease SbcCD ATPase subunit
VRFPHTADWHVGKPLRGRSRLDEHARALEQVGIVTHVRELAERLPARLEVRRQGSTSAVVVV